METSSLQQLLDEHGIEFNFSNLKNLGESEISYSQFLAFVAQRLLLKQYSAQAVDESNMLCFVSRASEIFNNNKSFFGGELKNLALKKKDLSIINAQLSGNKITEKEQENTAKEFVKWYESSWFDRLKSEDFVTNLDQLFRDHEIPTIKESNNDWKTLSLMYKSVDEENFFDKLGIDSKVFINESDSASPDWFNDVIEDCYKFIELTGTTNLSYLKTLISKQSLICPTTSAFMISTMVGIEEVESGKKRYVSPFETYGLFRIFKDTSMGHLLVMNQFVFTLYNYFKILEK
jgi:hypothetical protein